MKPLEKIENKNEYKFAVGSLLYLCQRIEHDIKEVYFLMSGDHSDEFYNHIKTMYINEVVDNLEQYECLNGSSLLSSDDYDLLRRINDIAGYYAHECYADWVYLKDSEVKENIFNESKEKLIEDHNTLLELRRVIEDLRIELFTHQN